MISIVLTWLFVQVELEELELIESLRHRLQHQENRQDNKKTQAQLEQQEQDNLLLHHILTEHIIERRDYQKNEKVIQNQNEIKVKPIKTIVPTLLSSDHTPPSLLTNRVFNNMHEAWTAARERNQDSPFLKYQRDYDPESPYALAYQYINKQQ